MWYEEIEVTVRMEHHEWGQSCKHTDRRLVQNLEKAIGLAENWPMPTGYSLIESRVRSRTVSDWREVYYHA